MKHIRRADDRGHTRTGWLNSRHSFSFGQYYDPEFRGFRALRVLNDDIIQPGTGFGEHSHRDMEIISYVVRGALAHSDSMGNEDVIQAGDIQRMTAGTGVRHAEYNHYDDRETRFLQIWIPPDEQGLEPGYEQRHFDRDGRAGKLTLLVAPGGPDGALDIHRDVRILGGMLEAGDTATYELGEHRHGWVQVVNGHVRIDGSDLLEGDGLAVSDIDELQFEAAQDAEFLILDLP
jgi:hypothetical protein